AGIPVELLDDRIAEGRAKEVPAATIAEVGERRLASLTSAQRVLGGVNATAAAELAAGADAVEAGIPGSVLRAVVAGARREDRPVAIAVLTYLHREEGLPVDAALARVTEAVSRGPEALREPPVQAAARPNPTPPPGRAAGRPADAGRPPAVAVPTGVPGPGQQPGGGRPGDTNGRGPDVGDPPGQGGGPPGQGGNPPGQGGGPGQGGAPPGQGGGPPGQGGGPPGQGGGPPGQGGGPPGQGGGPPGQGGGPPGQGGGPPGQGGGPPGQG